MSPAPPACILVRHAHAEWPAYRGRDFDRPLTARGEVDALATGEAIRAAGLMPRRIIASAARRTAQTASILADQLHFPRDAIQLLDSLYNAGPAALESALHKAATDGGPVLMVAHNPGISDLARMLATDEDAPSFRPADWRTFGINSAVDTATPR